ncbi:MAG: RHS repeat-associated core domain-containing protein [Acidobacteriota bacterium]
MGGDRRGNGYSWVVTGPPSDHCLISVGAPNGIPCDTSDKEFRILQDIVVSKPQAGEHEMGSFMEIRWTPRNWPKNVKVELQRDGGQWESLTAPDTSIANEGKMTWKVTGSASQNCYIRVSDAKDGKPFGDSAKFAIVPSVKVLYPNGGEQLMVGKTVKLEWETRGSVPNVKLELSRNRGTTWELVDGRASVPNDGKYAWTVKGTKTSNNCLFRVSDLDGKPTDTSDNLFAIRTVSTGGAAGPGTQAGVDMLVGDEMEQQPGALPWSKPWLEDLPGGTMYIPGADGLADRLLQVPEDDGEYVGTEEDFERDFGGVEQPPPGDTPGEPAPEPEGGGEPEVAGPPLPAGSEITYYIYSFDGRLLAEYDSDGYCNRDYIYAGNRLIAEYKPKVGIYHFYTPDQINTTRIITDQAGQIAYSAAHGPFGNEQITWVDKYNPALKFSGKERDPDTTFDYFGARYFASTQRRWISPDPIVGVGDAMAIPQRWNLYAYVANNPITYLDPNGMYMFANGTAEQREAFQEALDQECQKLSEMTGEEKVAAEIAIGAYGEPYEDNGVWVVFGDPGGGRGGATDSHLLPDLGSFSTVTISPDLSGTDLTIVMAHEGSHVADHQRFSAAVRSVSPTDSSIIGSDQFDLTRYATEVRAYGVSAFVANSLGQEEGVYGRKNRTIFKRGKLNMGDLNKYLKEEYEGLSPESPGRRLSGFE